MRTTKKPELIYAYLARSGVSKLSFYKHMGLTAPTAIKKMKTGNWTVAELKRIKSALNLSDDEIQELIEVD